MQLRHCNVQSAAGIGCIWIVRGAFDSAHSFHRAEGLHGMAWKKICLHGYRVYMGLNFSNRGLFAIVVYTRSRTGLDCARSWTSHGTGLEHTGGIHGPGWDKRAEYTGLAGTNGWNTRAWLEQTGGKIVVCMITARGKPWEAPIVPIHGFLEHFSPWNDYFPYVL